jgi:hypothetical protein
MPYTCYSIAVSDLELVIQKASIFWIMLKFRGIATEQKFDSSQKLKLLKIKIWQQTSIFFSNRNLWGFLKLARKRADPEQYERMMKKIEDFFDRDKFVSFYSSIPQFILQVGIVLNTGNFGM